MALLVTGAMGHVGFAIVRTAVRRGYAVVAQYRRRFDADAAAALGGGVVWVHNPLAAPADIAELVAGRSVTACIHCAAVSNEAFALPDPLGTVAANIGATSALLETARQQSWRFLHVSTGSVFQLRTDRISAIPEDTPPEPGGVYGSTKHAAELLVAMYRRVYELPAANVRISWVFGPPVASLSPTRGPIPSFLVRALRGEAIRESGADFAASFTHVEDVADGLLAAAEAEKLRHDIYHLGHGVNFSAAAVADAVRAAVPGTVIELGPGTEPWTRYTGLRGPLAGTRLRDDTGFTPSRSLAAGIAAYAAWLRESGTYRDVASN